MSAPKNRADVVRVMADGVCGAVLPCMATHIGACECMRKAEAQLAVLEAAGLRVVPVEATEAMERHVNAHCDTPDAELGWTWQHWLAASPFAPDAEP